MTANTKSQGAATYPVPFAMGFASLIPVLGLVFSVASIAYGIRNRKKEGAYMMALGIGGVLVTVGLFLFVQARLFETSSSVSPDMQAEAAKARLIMVVKDLESYKLEHGRYPDRLQQLTDASGKARTRIYEPFLHAGKPETFYYELINGGQNYYLVSRGSDGVLGTADDLAPGLGAGAADRVGYRKKDN